MVYPANLTVIAESIGQDSQFNFKIQYPTEECIDVDDYDENGEWIDWHWECSTVWQDKESFSLQTENSTAEKNFPDVSCNGQYRIIEEVISGLKLNSISCVSDDSSVSFLYQQNSVEFTPQPKANITCTFNNKKIKTPVLIVPGLVGTEIKDDDELLWPNLTKMLGSASDDFMDSLAFNKDLVPIDMSVSKKDIVKNPDNSFDYTEGLIDEFRKQDYVEDETLFAFPYDWRYGVSGKYANGKTNSDLLGEKILGVMTKTGSDKVDVIAHSMGGLIVKKYVTEHLTDNHVGKAVFVGVPNTGAPKSVKVLLQGDNFGVSFLKFGLADAEIKKIAENMPASYDLLPSQKYYDVKGSFVETIEVVHPTFENPSAQNIVKDLNYEEFKTFLTDRGFNSLAMSNAEGLHTQSFDDFDLRTAGVELYAIDGCKKATLEQVIEIKEKNFFGEEETSYNKNVIPLYGHGDGTVPLESATNLPIDASKKYYALVSDHGKMLSENGTRQQIVNLISGSNLDLGTDYFNGAHATGDIITQDISQCQLNGKAISVFSPVDISVTDQSGNKLGLASDGSILNEIPNADFEIWGEPANSADRHKFVYLPTDDGQTYTTSLVGTGVGTYTIRVQDIVNSEIGQTEVFSNLSVSSELVGQINLGAGTTLSLKQAPEGPVETVLPSSSFTAFGSGDYFPPVSTATLTGDKDEQGIYKSEVEVEIKAVDDSLDTASGVLAIEYNLDGVGFQKVAGDAATITVSNEGKHTLVFFSTDKAGNNEQEQTINFEIVFPLPLPPDPLPKTPELVADENPAPDNVSLPIVARGGGGGNSFVGLNQAPASQNIPTTIIPTPVLAPVVALTPIVAQAQIEKPNKILSKKQTEPIVVQKNSQPIGTAALSNNTNFLGYIKNFGKWIVKNLFARFW